MARPPGGKRFSRTAQGQVYVSDIFFDPSFGTHVVNVSVPILDDEQHA